MSLSGEKRVKYFQVGDIVANSDAIKHALWYLPRRIKIAGVKFAVDAAITAQDSDYNTIALTDGTNTIASIVTGPAATGDSLSAGVWLAASTGPVAAYVEQAAAATLKLEFTKTGNGLAMSALAVQIEYYEYDV